MTLRAQLQEGLRVQVFKSLRVPASAYATSVRAEIGPLMWQCLTRARMPYQAFAFVVNVSTDVYEAHRSTLTLCAWNCDLQPSIKSMPADASWKPRLFGCAVCAVCGAGSKKLPQAEPISSVRKPYRPCRFSKHYHFA